jgi:hypothetical protein
MRGNKMDRATTEVLCATFLALANSGGLRFRNHCGKVLREVLDHGLVTEPQAKRFLADLAVAAESDEAAPPT